jgi:hypothetical protein
MKLSVAKPPNTPTEIINPLSDNKVFKTTVKSTMSVVNEANVACRLKTHRPTKSNCNNTNHKHKNHENETTVENSDNHVSRSGSRSTLETSLSVAVEA